MMEPASVKKLKEDRRSSSVDTSGDQELVLQTICYDGKTLKLPSDDHMHQVMYRILKNVYHPLVDQILVGLPQGWADPKKVPTNAEIVLYTKSFNIAAKPYAKNWRGSFNTETLKDWGQPRCTVKVASDITTFAYECAVPRPADLNNHYKSFSSETYGETNLNQMASIIDELGIGPSDVFVDLGSGIGQLVCFTAAYAGCKKAVGIELSPKPAEHAADLAEYFKRLMKHFGKQCSKFELIKGNFLDPQFKKLICDEATVIFINNYAFGPDLMFNITNLLLQDLKHGTRIVTTKPFGQNKREITFRSTSDINSMSDTIELKSLESGVSWTANKVTFWLTTMDHTKLIRYYEEEQRKKQDLQSTSREGSEFVERETPTKKRKADRDNNVRDKHKTEQAAASQPNRSPKWNEQDTEYVPSAKKPKKNREGHEPKSSIDVEKSEKKKKKEKVPSTPKTPKTPKHSKENRQNHSVESSASQDQMTPVSHPLPSLAKATAPPPTHQDQKPKIDESIDISEKNYGNFDAKTMKALNTIREAASTSTQAAAIQDAIDTVLSHPESPPNPTMALPPGYPLNQNIQAPVAVYPQPHIIAPPPPPPSNIIPPSSEVLVEQRHTFMIPPTDPFYQMVVSTYFEFKNYCHQAKTADPQIIIQLRHEIESEKARQNDLHEAIGATNAQIEYYLNKGVNCLKNRLDELGMTSVNDVSELLSGSKQIVTQHKSLTTDVHQMETNVMLEEQKLKMIGGPEALRLFDEAIAHVNNLDVIRLAEGIVTHRPINYTAHSIQVDDVAGSDAKVSPSRRSRNPKPPRTTNPGSGNGKRGASATRKADGTNEKMEMEIREFVKHAMQVDHAVKEKERKARSNLIAASERLPRKGATAPSGTSHLLQCSPSPTQITLPTQ